MPKDDQNQFDWLSHKAGYLHAIMLFSLVCLQVGCWSEVAYEPVAQNDNAAGQEDEAAPFEAQEELEAPAFTDVDSLAEDPEDNVSLMEENPSAQQDSPAESIEETVKPTPPWLRNDNQSSDLSEDAARYFGGTDDTTNESTQPREIEEEPDEDLDDLIAMLRETEVASSSPSNEEMKPKRQPKPTAQAPVTNPSPKPTKPLPSSESLTGNRYSSVVPKITEPLEFEIPKTPRKKKKSREEPSAESAKEPANLTGSRYADVETEPDERLPWEIENPTANPIASTVESEPEVTATEPLIKEEPPEEITSLEPKQPTFAEQAPPKLASLDPLPSVPVLSYNTQHLAWLLGGKLGLAHLAASEGATEDEIAIWIKETEVLSNKLEIPLPQLASDSQEVAVQVTTLLEAAARTGEDLRVKHGVNHAALLEISLKTNALLVLSEKHPELAPAIAKAVEDAAERAELPSFLWRKMHTALIDGATPDEIFEAVSEMHDNVESYLR